MPYSSSCTPFAVHSRKFNILIPGDSVSDRLHDPTDGMAQSYSTISILLFSSSMMMVPLFQGDLSSREGPDEYVDKMLAAFVHAEIDSMLVSHSW